MRFISNDIEDCLENQQEELYPIYTKIIEELLKIDAPSIEDAFYTDIFRDLYVLFGKKNPISLRLSFKSIRKYLKFIAYYDQSSRS